MNSFFFGFFFSLILIMVVLNRHPVAPLIIDAEGGNIEMRFVVDCKTTGDDGVHCTPDIKEINDD